MKLPPRFKIYHNVSEDYYFIKERFCFFWYRTEKEVVAYDGSTADNQYSSLGNAEAKVQFLLEYEKQSKIPDKIKLVKEYD